MKKTNNKGFSLIELIIVIAIMAILIAIIAPNLTKYLGKSKEKTDVKNLDEIESTLKTCITDYDMENESLLGDSEDNYMILEWNQTDGAKVQATNGTSLSPANSSATLVNNTTVNPKFEAIVNASIEKEKAKSKKTSKYAIAMIEYTSQGQYKITVDWAS